MCRHWASTLVMLRNATVSYRAAGRPPVYTSVLILYAAANYDDVTLRRIAFNYRSR